jgi:hypothetical protein
MGRKWAKVGLTSDGTLYISEEVRPGDAMRLEKAMTNPEKKEQLEKRMDDLIVALGAKWG